MVSAKAAAGPSATTPGAITVIGRGATGGGGAPHSASHWVSCALETAYTMRPSPTHACAAAHMTQCSPEVYTVASARSAGDKFFAAQRAIANSGWRVASPPATRL